MNDLATKTTMKIDMRFGEFGVKHATIIGKDTEVFKKGDTLDLVRFTGDGNVHYVIGAWRPDSEGYHFESVGNRLFDCLEEYEVSKIWPVLKAVQNFLDDVFYE